MNEDEPSPLHTNYFVDYVRSRKVPFAQHWGGSPGTAGACMGNVAYWTGRKIQWDGQTFSFRRDKEANAHTFLPYANLEDLVKFS